VHRVRVRVRVRVRFRARARVRRRLLVAGEHVGARAVLE